MMRKVSVSNQHWHSGQGNVTNTRPALFHQWVVVQDTQQEDNSTVQAIVEYFDGQVGLVPFDRVEFSDTKDYRSE